MAVVRIADSPKRLKQARKRAESRIGWLMLAPTLIILLAFVLGPLVLGIGLSFTHYNLLNGQISPAGLSDYQDLLASGSAFWTALGNTVLFSLGTVVPTVVIAILFGMLLNQQLAARGVYRAILFAPYVTPLVGSSIAWIWMFRGQGFIDWILGLFGIHGPSWLGNPHTALIAIMIASIWQYAGYFTMLMLSGLQSIPGEVEEAARMDGAGGLALFRKITLPLLSPTVLFCLILSVIQSFQVFDQIYVMTNGGPGTSTLTLVYFLYQEGFEFFHIGHGAAVGVLLLVMLLALTWGQLKLSGKWVHYDL